MARSVNGVTRIDLMTAGVSLPSPERITRRLLDRVEITAPPVHLTKVVALWRNLHVVEEDLDSAGYLLPLGKLGAEIVVNKNDRDERRLFTIAHELGHWVLGLICEKKIGEFRQPPGIPKASIESWCDAFATNLLMPASFVKEWLPRKEQPILIDAILRAADRFNVSEETFFIRVWELQRIQIALVKLRGTPSIERTYGDAEKNKLLTQTLRDPAVDQQLRYGNTAVFFTLRDAKGKVYVSGRKRGPERFVLAVAWPELD